jgi:hypothetical protein
MPKENLNSAPKDPIWEAMANVAGQGVVGAVPLVGAFGAASIASVFQARSARRVQALIENILNRLQVLEDQGVLESVRDLLSAPSFSPVLIEALAIAERNALGDKLRALESGVVNSIGDSQNTDLKLMFLRCIEDLTVSHLLLLELLDSPKGYFEKHNLEWFDLAMGGKVTVIREAFPDWDTYFSDQLIADLNSRGLVGITTQHGMTTLTGMAESSTTSLGKTFISFIKDKNTP